VHSEAIEHAIEYSNYLWFEGLAEQLVRDTWQELARHGHTPDRYGTHRFLTNDPAGERRVVGSVRTLLDGLPAIIVEVLPDGTSQQFGGVRLADQIGARAAMARLQEAFGLIERVATLSHSISWLLRALHLLLADPEFDVSRSDPGLPFSIFVSAPRSDELHGALRLAEQIVHECMHLQLTFIEQRVTLVDKDKCTLASPWQRRQRPVQGILHGLYVFGVVSAFFGLLAAKLQDHERQFAERRRADITVELLSVRSVIDALTPIGQRLANRILASCAN
jgi:HEXXH motif-containing protein